MGNCIHGVNYDAVKNTVVQYCSTITITSVYLVLFRFLDLFFSVCACRRAVLTGERSCFVPRNTYSQVPRRQSIQDLGGPVIVPVISATKNYTYGFIMACIELYATGQNSLSHCKARIWLPVAFKKNSRHTHQNRLKSSPVSERSAYPLQNYVCFSSLTPQFWPQIYCLWHALDWGLLSKILASTEMGGA